MIEQETKEPKKPVAEKPSSFGVLDPLKQGHFARKTEAAKPATPPAQDNKPPAT